uniref:Uncharacterized protein n=1 Tax=Nelumbo nucifera TaxID=4432 RepID=A0A822XWT3_NELNU|nr:TPA_asm: hypothetical protein HUJ06_023311 [Nelumbo nucifera]
MHDSNYKWVLTQRIPPRVVPNQERVSLTRKPFTVKEPRK